MKGYLKYLLSLFVIAFFWNQESHVPEASIADIHIQEDSYVSTISACDSDLYLPLHKNYSYAHRAKTITRRIAGIHHIAFLKTSKVNNDYICRFCLNHSLFMISALTDPGQRLLHLGRLII